MSPALTLFLRNISLFPGVLSYHTMCTLFPDTAIDGAPEKPAVLLKLTVLPKEDPLSVLL